jgi:hypothetical protein
MNAIAIAIMHAYDMMIDDDVLCFALLTDDGWEDSSWSIITSEAGFAHTRTIVNDESLNIT